MSIGSLTHSAPVVANTKNLIPDRLPNAFVEITWEYRLLISIYFVVWIILPQVAEPFFAFGPNLDLVVALSLLSIIESALILWPIVSTRFGNTQIGWLHPLVLPALLSIASSLIKSPISLADPIANLGHTTITAHMLVTGRSLLSAQMEVKFWSVLALICTYVAFWFFSPPAKFVLNRPKIASRFRFFITVGAILLLAIVVFSLSGGIMEHIAKLAGGRFRTFGTLGILIVPITFLPLLMLLWYLYRPPSFRQPWFIALFVIAALLQFMVLGSRSGLFSAIILLFLGWIYLNRKLPLVRIFLIGMLAILTLSTLVQIRQIGSTTDSQFSSDLPTSISQSIEKNRIEVAARQYVSGPIGIAARIPRQNDYMMGQTYVGGLLFFVPRSIWRDKPRGPGPTLYAVVFSGLSDAEGYEGMGTPPSGEGEAFMNFGYLGIILIYSLFGIFLKWVAVRGITRRTPYMVAFLILVGSSLSAPSTTAIVPFLQSWVMLALSDRFIARKLQR